MTTPEAEQLRDSIFERVEHVLRERRCIPSDSSFNYRRGRVIQTTRDGKYGIACIPTRFRPQAKNNKCGLPLCEPHKVPLNSCIRAWVALGCGSVDIILLVPWEVFQYNWMPKMRHSPNDGVEQWDAYIYPGFELDTPNDDRCEKLNVNEFLLS